MYDLAGFSSVPEAPRTDTKNRMQSAVALAMVLPSMALAPTGGIPLGYLGERSRVLRDLSRALEKVAHGGGESETPSYSPR